MNYRQNNPSLTLNDESDSPSDEENKAEKRSMKLDQFSTKWF